MKPHLQALKDHLKAEASKLKALKQERKVRENGYVEELWGTRMSYRAHHRVYCLMRGRTMAQIEKDLPDPQSWTERTLQRIQNTVWEKFREVAATSLEETPNVVA